MFAHQRLAPRNHPIFGRISPYGIKGWRTQDTRKVRVFGEERNVNVTVFISDQRSKAEQQNFETLMAALDTLSQRYVDLQLEELAELDEKPYPWQELFFELSLDNRSYALGPQWVGKGYGGVIGDCYHLFFEGLELKGIVPEWCDPAAKGFEGWEW
jgi:hypothetical protein